MRFLLIIVVVCCFVFSCGGENTYEPGTAVVGSPKEKNLKPSKKPPNADYDFSIQDRTTVIDNYLLALEQSFVALGSDQYRYKYSQPIAAELIQGQVRSYFISLLEHVENKSKIAFLMPAKPTKDSYCTLYIEALDMTALYDCSDNTMIETENGYAIDAQALSVDKPEKIHDASLPDIKVHISDYDAITLLGTTELSIEETELNELHIKTNNPFQALPELFLLEETSLSATTFIQLKEILDQQAMKGDINKTLVFDTAIGGSIDDQINMYTGLLIRESGLNTRIAMSGSVESGGTDLFSAGLRRELVLDSEPMDIAQAKKIGVHAWSDTDPKTGKEISANNIPYSNKLHRAQATYFKKVLGDKGIPFYLYTLEAATPDGMHYMNRQEIDKYHLVTDYIRAF